MKVFVSADAAARSVGADAVANAIAAQARDMGRDVTIVRMGTRGMLWLEPLVEVETPAGRTAFGPVTTSDVPSLFAAGFLDDTPAARAHALAHGLTGTIPYLERQQRLTFARVGVIDPLSLEEYRAHGGMAGLERARAMSPVQVLDEVAASGLRGRGGAGFPTGIKARTVREAVAPRKYVVCNADEGDSGTFADRMLIEGDPFLLLEGMLIAGYAVGATRGVIYLRSEYPHAITTMRRAIVIAREQGVLGEAFDVEVRVGGGSYVCGEETSLLESVEGRRPQVRAKPPLPAHHGLFGRPTLINNVLSFAAVPWILANTGSAYANHGLGRSRGSMPVQLAGNVKHGGLFEIAFGVTLRRLVYDIGGGTLSGRPVKAVQVGGPLGAYFPESLLDTPLDYEALAAAGGLLGHGGIVVFDDTVDMARQARFAFEFCALESCGKCTPCRIGSTRGAETLDKVARGIEPERNLELVKDLCTVLTDASLCALGGLTPLPVLSALTHFRADFTRDLARDPS